MVLAHVYRRFTFELAPGQVSSKGALVQITSGGGTAATWASAGMPWLQVPLKLSPGITLTPTNGVWARVRPREAAKAAAVP